MTTLTVQGETQKGVPIRSCGTVEFTGGPAHKRSRLDFRVGRSCALQPLRYCIVAGGHKAFCPFEVKELSVEDRRRGVEELRKRAAEPELRAMAKRARAAAAAVNA